MKSEHRANFSIDGTSALKLPNCQQRTRTATIIEFPGARRTPRVAEKPSSTPSTPIALIKSKAISVLEASEMYCSLRLEDVRGFAYNCFNARNVAVLSTATTVIAVVALAVSA